MEEIQKDIREACDLDAKKVSMVEKKIERFEAQLVRGVPSTVLAGEAILEGVIELSKLNEDQIKKHVNSLWGADGKGALRQLKYNKRAAQNLALPLAMDGYRNKVSASHISKVAAVVGYAFYACAVTPDNFNAFLLNEHKHSKGQGNGLSHAYQAAREFFSEEEETPAERAARRRAKVVTILKGMPTMATITESLSVMPSEDGLYCFLARTAANGNVEIVTPARNSEANLITYLLDHLADQWKIKAKAEQVQATQEKPMTPAKLKEMAQMAEAS